MSMQQVQYFHPMKDVKFSSSSDIVLVDDIDKAKKAAGNTGVVFKVKMKDGKIFDITNPAHRTILQTRLPFNNFQKIVTNQTLDWNELDILWNAEADDPDELLSPLGFMGLKFTKNGDDFVLIFDRKNVKLEDIAWASPVAKVNQPPIPKLPKISDIVKEEIQEVQFNTTSINEHFFHQTNQTLAKEILMTWFQSHLHDGQARFTHGVYFLKHGNASYGDTTLKAKISGSFIDLTDDDLGDKWIALRDSVEWNNHKDLTIKLRQKYHEADGIVLHNKYLIVVWYPEKCISEIELVSKK